MANRDRYGAAHHDLGSMDDAREFLGPNADELAWRAQDVLAAGDPELQAAAGRMLSAEIAHEVRESENAIERKFREAGEMREAAARQAVRLFQLAAQTARRLAGELDKAIAALKPIDLAALLEANRAVARRRARPRFRAPGSAPHAQRDSLPGDAAPEEARLSTLIFLSKRLNAGLPMGMPTCAELRAVASGVHALLDADRQIRPEPSTQAPRRKPRPRKATDLSSLSIQLAVHLRAIVGKHPTPKQWAAAEVLARHSPLGQALAAAAIRKWERYLARAREFIRLVNQGEVRTPTVMALLEERRRES